MTFNNRNAISKFIKQKGSNPIHLKLVILNNKALNPINVQGHRKASL